MNSDYHTNLVTCANSAPSQLANDAVQTSPRPQLSPAKTDAATSDVLTSLTHCIKLDPLLPDTSNAIATEFRAPEDINSATTNPLYADSSVGICPSDSATACDSSTADSRRPLADTEHIDPHKLRSALNQQHPRDIATGTSCLSATTVSEASPTDSCNDGSASVTLPGGDPQLPHWLQEALTALLTPPPPATAVDDEQIGCDLDDLLRFPLRQQSPSALLDVMAFAVPLMKNDYQLYLGPHRRRQSAPAITAADLARIRRIRRLRDDARRYSQLQTHCDEHEPSSEDSLAEPAVVVRPSQCRRRCNSLSTASSSLTSALSAPTLALTDEHSGKTITARSSLSVQHSDSSAASRRRQFVAKKVRFGTFEQITYVRNSAPHPRSLDDSDIGTASGEVAKNGGARAPSRRLSLLRLAFLPPLRRLRSRDTADTTAADKQSPHHHSVVTPLPPISPTSTPRTPPPASPKETGGRVTKWFSSSKK